MVCKSRGEDEANRARAIMSVMLGSQTTQKSCSIYKVYPESTALYAAIAMFFNLLAKLCVASFSVSAKVK
jgi:hypothetical protein